MEYSWWMGILAAMAAFLWALSLVVVRSVVRRQLLKELARAEAPAAEPVLHLPDPRPEDLRALEIISTYRRRLFTNPWPDTRFGFAAVSETAQNLLGDIARAYYPEEERPELKASLADLVGLVNRVGTRLNLWLNTLPVRPLKDLEIKTVLRYHELYQQVAHHPAYQFLKRHRLDQAARWLWTAKNLLNPWYWSRRAAYTGSREVFARLFLAQVVSLVGEEAIRIYGHRQPHAALKRRLQLTLQEMINLSLEDGHLPPPVQSTLLRFILKAKGLDDQDRLGLIAQLAVPRAAELPPPHTLEPADRRHLAHSLKYLARTCFRGPERELRLHLIKERWEGQ